MTKAAPKAPKADRIPNAEWWRIAFLGLAFAAFFWRFLFNQARYSLHPDWSHAYLVPVISAYFIYENRERIFRIPVNRNWLGFPIMLLGMAVYFFFWLGPTWNHSFQGAGLVICLLGIVLLMLGYRMWLALLFPVLYLSLGVRAPPRIMGLFTPTLQRWAAIGSEHLLNIVGYQAERSGNLIEVFHDGSVIPLNVAEACSGMRMIVAFMALGVAVAFLICRHWWQRVILIAAGVPVAIVVNALRVATIGVMATIDESWSAGDAHIFIGLVWLIPALLLYLGIVWVLQHLVIEEKAKDRQTTDIGSAGTRKSADGPKNRPKTRKDGNITGVAP